jgi:(p)ppGpp synthase/HD superfamily hydrolase
MSLIDVAIEFAAKARSSQFRKGTDIPYISHPYGVGLILQQAGCGEEEIIAGILHDTIEDTAVTEEDIQSVFGASVLLIVKGCSEPNKEASWEERKEHTLEYLKQAHLSVRQVSCADKLHNLRSIKRDLADRGESAWGKFKRGRDAQKWYYTGVVESLGYSGTFPLLEELRVEVEAVFGAES